MSEPLPAEVTPRLHAALDALLHNRNAAPISALLAETRTDVHDVWLEAAAYLLRVDLSEVTPYQRYAVKHACYFLIHETQPRIPPSNVVRELLTVFHRPAQ